MLTVAWFTAVCQGDSMIALYALILIIFRVPVLRSGWWVSPPVSRGWWTGVNIPF